jgi:transcriptional regulator with XRE-family HTH domain
VENLNNLGERLQWARKKQGLTQYDIEESGVMKQSVYSKLERGLVANTSKIVELSDILNVSTYWLQTGKGSHESTIQLSKLTTLENAIKKYNLTEDEIALVEKYAIEKANEIFLKK